MLFARVFSSPIQEPGADRPVTDPKGCGNLTQAVAQCLQLDNPFAIYRTLRATEHLAIRSRLSNPGTHPFPYQITLKLRHRRDDSKKGLTQRATRVDVLLIGNKLDSQRPKLLQRRKQVFGGASKPIKAPHHDCVELPLPGVVHQFVQFGA